jgi:hypothetical protein
LKTGLKQLGLLFVACALPLSAIAQDSLKKHYSDEELINILKDDGYRAIEQTDDRVISIKVDGLTYVLYLYDDDDLQLYFGVTGYVLDAGQLNDWNRTKRLSRAYLDDDNDPILEADLLANAGYTKEQFLEWFRVFNFSAMEFRQFLIENDQDK